MMDLTAAFDTDAILARLKAVLENGRYINGPEVQELEQKVSDYLGVEYAVGLNSGTDALVIGLRAAGIEEGDEVITTPFTFFATAEAIHHCKAKPIYVDIDPNTFNLDMDLVEKALTPRTKAIICVHMFGNACDMAHLEQICQKHSIKLIEDCAQSFSGTYHGKKLGSFGDVGALSFFPSKNLGSIGDAGMIVTNSHDIYTSAKMLRSHGSLKKYHNETIGYNSRLDTIQAAFLLEKIIKIDEAFTRRNEIAALYSEILAGNKGIHTPKPVQGHGHSFHQYTLRVEGGRRDGLKEWLATKLCDSMIYYPIPLHKLPIYQNSDMGPLPISERICSEVLSLPIWPEMSNETVEKVAELVQDYFRRS